MAINPVILEQKGAVKDREGCLSFPGLYQDIRRAKALSVVLEKALVVDPDGNVVQLDQRA